MSNKQNMINNMEQSKTQRPSGRVDELLDALPKYIEAQVKKEMLAHLKDYHNMSFGIDDIYGCCDTVRNFEKDLSLYSKSIQQRSLVATVSKGEILDENIF